jgi:integrase
MPATTNYRLGEAIEEFLLTRRASGIAPSTVAQNRVHLSQVLTEIGNIQVRNLTARHVDMVFASWTSKAPSTLNTQTSTLKTFLQWCGRRGLLPRGDDIMAAYVRRRKEPEKQRLQVPVDKFPALLDAATHPRDRMVVALGLYLFLRQSEIKTIRIGDVDFTNSEIAVTVHKTKQFDRMPISSELDAELRRYLEWYTAKCGVPEKQWFLTPSKYSVCATWTDGRFAHDPSKEAVIRPTRPIGSPYRIVKAVLEDLGYGTFQGRVSHTATVWCPCAL